MTNKWYEFPGEPADFTYTVDELKESWERLHQGDREPYPDLQFVEELESQYGILNGAPAEDVQAGLEQAWILYHQGAFAEAAELGLSLGFAGYYVANKSTLIYASYLEEDEDQALALFEQACEHAEQALEAMPEHANSHYSHAFALGRYSQGISITKALVDGLAGKVKVSLDKTLELQPEHGDAHIASGLYHAEIIDKVGKLVAGMTYGAKPAKAEKHFEAALACSPDTAITKMEYANALLMLYGDKRYDQASDLYVEAAETEPADAMEYLDIETAKAELE